MPKLLFGSSAFAANAAALFSNCPAALQTRSLTKRLAGLYFHAFLTLTARNTHSTPLHSSALYKSKRFYERFTVYL